MKLIRYGFPIIGGLFLGFMFFISPDFIKALIVAFIGWAVLEIAGKVNYD